jgi:hypothetical protein
MSLVFGIDSTVIVVGLGIVVAICIAIGLVAIQTRDTKRAKLNKITKDPARIPRYVQKIPADITKVNPNPGAVAASAPHPTEINCIHGMTDISQSLIALARKYSLDEIALATSDGLLLATSSRTPAAEEIARYTGLYTANPRTQSPGIVLFGMEHKGSSLIGIAKTAGQNLQESRQDLIRETKDILNWWI